MKSYGVPEYIFKVKTLTRSNSLQACIVMTLGLCFHFLGYECARAASITLLASKEFDLGNQAIPLTIAVGSPLSGAVLYVYTKSIKKFGSKFTLRISCFSCIVILALVAIYVRSMKGLMGKVVIVFFYAFREIYVSLLSSQQWAFIAGNLDKSTSSYIVTFGGIVSVASAVGGCAIEQLVAYGGIQLLLNASLLSVICSALCTEVAYSTLDSSQNRSSGSSSSSSSSSNSSSSSRSSSSSSSSSNTHTAEEVAHTPEFVYLCNGNNTVSNSTSQQKHSVNTDDSLRKRHASSAKKATAERSATTNPTTSADKHTLIHKHTAKTGFWMDSWKLISAHHMLQVLLVEGVLHQFCGNMLNLMFHNALRLEVVDETTRAMLVGRFFASVNITSCTLQCFVLPYVLSHSTLPSVLKKIPLLVLFAVGLGIINPGLVSVMLGFGAIKVLEYSILHSASEMMYMPLGHEVRYLGKELVRFFGHKLGKSGSSLLLSALVSQLNPSLAVQSVWGALLTVSWAASMRYLAGYISARNKVDEAKAEASELGTENNSSNRAVE